jgi:hypothetical protein
MLMKGARSKQEKRNVQLQETVDEFWLQRQKLKNDHRATLNEQDQRIKPTVKERCKHVHEELSSAKSKAALCTKTLARLEDSESRVSMLKQDITQLRAGKVRSELNTKKLKTTMKSIQEGYNQLKEAKRTLEAEKIDNLSEIAQ